MTAGAAGSDPVGNPEDPTSLKEYLYDRLRDAATPVFVFQDSTIPGASVWTGSRHWVNSFRNRNLKPGDRLLVDLPPGPVLLQVIVAGIWNRLSLVLEPPGADRSDPLEALDARGAILSEESSHRVSGETVWQAGGLAGPESEPSSLRTTQLNPSPEIRFWLQSSGTLGRSGYYGLSDVNLLSVLRSHSGRLREADTLLSYLPWDHCFGLVFDLLYTLHNEMTLVRTPSKARSPEVLMALFDEHSVDHFNTVPAMVETLSEAGFSNWSRFREGIVGGAPISRDVARTLAGTDLRVGYGQTEASPGITLGEPGVFESRLLGRPLGCELSIDDQNELHFTGRNAYRAELHPDGPDLRTHEVPRTLATGDLAEREGDQLFFRGRKGHRFKLSNGRFVDPLAIEDDFNRSLPREANSVLVPDGDGGFRLFVEAEGIDSGELADRFRSEHPGIADYMTQVRSLSPQELPRTAKGELDRTSLKDDPDRFGTGE